MIENEELKQAWDRTARSADGHLIFLHLQRKVMEMAPPADDSTLREHNGERRFAAFLMGLMAKGIEESAAGLASSAITFAVAGPRSVSRSRGAGRRISDTDRIAGYDAGPDGGPAPDAGNA